MNLEVIIWSCVTVGVLIGICAIVLGIISARELQAGIKVGARILFAGGIYGKIVKVRNDIIDVEVNKSTVIQISRYSIQNVISE